MQEIRPHFFCDFIFKKVFPFFIMKKEEMQEMLAARPAAKVQKSIETHFLTIGSDQNPIKPDKIR